MEAPGSADIAESFDSPEGAGSREATGATLSAGQPEGRTGASGDAEIDFQRKPEGASARERDGSNERERVSQSAVACYRRKASLHALRPMLRWRFGWLPAYTFDFPCLAQGAGALVL